MAEARIALFSLDPAPLIRSTGSGNSEFPKACIEEGSTRTTRTTTRLRNAQSYTGLRKPRIPNLCLRLWIVATRMVATSDSVYPVGRISRIEPGNTTSKKPRDYRLVSTGDGEADRVLGAAVCGLGAGVAGATSGFEDSRWIEVTTGADADSDEESLREAMRAE